MAVDNDITAILAMADLAGSKGDYARSLILLRDALNKMDKSASGDTKQRLDILMKLAEVNHITGEWVDALMCLDNAFRTASENHLRSVMAEALLVSGTILSKKGKWDIAQRKFDQALSIMGPENVGPPAARAMIGKGTISWRRGQGDEAIQFARKAMAMEGAENDHNIIGGAWALMSCAAFDMGDYTQSLESNEKALAHFREAGNTMEVARILNNTGETHKVMGDYSKAIDNFNQGLALSSTGSPRSTAYLLTNIAECHARQGMNKDARTFAHSAEGKAAGIQDDYLHAMLDFVWALIHESENEASKAEKSYLSAIDKMQSLGIPFDTGMMQTAYGRFLMGQKRAEDAARVLTDALGSLRKSGSNTMAAQAEKLLAGIKN